MEGPRASGDSGERRSVEGSWERIEAWCSSHLPELLDDLRGGAGEGEIRAAEEALGLTLPEDVRRSYLVHDGQGGGDHENGLVTGVVFGLELQPLSRVLEWWKGHRDVEREYGDDELMNRFSRSYPEGAIRLRYLDPGWVPLTHDGSGNHLGVDLDPGPEGVWGQVIVFGRDEDEKYVAAESWGAFFADVAARLEVGDFRIDEEDGEPRWLNAKDPTLAHYHEEIKARRRRERGDGPPAP